MTFGSGSCPDGVLGSFGSTGLQDLTACLLVQILMFAFLCPAGSGSDIYPPVASPQAAL